MPSDVPSARRRFRADALALAAIALFTAAVYQKGWLDGAVFFSDDVATYSAPLYQYAADRLQHGELPHWNPYIYGGTPFLVNPQCGVFYPFLWITLLVPIDWAITGLTIGHQLLAAVLMYLFCRGCLGTGPFAAFVGGIVFAHGGYVAAHYLHTPQVMSASWLPGIVGAYFRGRSTRRVPWFVAGGCLLGLSILAGGVQATYLICVALLLIVLCDVVHPVAAATAGVRGRRWIPIGALGVIAAAAAAISAAQLLPTVAFIDESARAEPLSVSEASRFSLPPLSAALLAVCPHFYGHSGLSYWGIWNQHEMTIYTGWLPLMLAPFALANRAPHVRVFWVVLVVSLVLAMGDYTPMFGLLHGLFPGLGSFRAPARFILLFGFSVAGLAAVAMQQLLDQRRPFHLVWLLVLAALCAGLGSLAVWLVAREDFLARLVQFGIPGPDRDELLVMSQILEFQRRVANLHEHYEYLFMQTGLIAASSAGSVAILYRWPVLGRWVVGGVLAIDLFVFNQGLMQWTQAERSRRFLVRHDWMDFLAARASQFRCDLHEPWLPNSGMLHRLAVAQGYDAFLPQSRHRVLDSEARSRHARQRLDTLFAVGYQSRPASAPVVKPIELVSARDPTVVVRNEGVPRRMRLVYTAREVARAEQALDAALDPNFDHARQVILERQFDRLEPAPDPVGATAGAAFEPPSRDSDAAGVRVIEDAPERLRVECTTTRRAWLVIADAYWPAWQARVNGQPATLWRANYYFRAVAVPAGSATVELEYRDHRIAIGIAISAVSVSMVVALAVWTVYRRRRAPRS